MYWSWAWEQLLVYTGGSHRPDRTVSAEKTDPRASPAPSRTALLWEWDVPGSILSLWASTLHVLFSMKIVKARTVHTIPMRILC